MKRSNPLNLVKKVLEKVLDHDGGSSSASAGKNGSEGGRGSQVINWNTFAKARVLKGHITLTKAIRSSLVEGNQTHTTFLNVHIIKPLIKNRRKLRHALKPNQKVLPKNEKKKEKKKPAGSLKRNKTTNHRE